MIRLFVVLSAFSSSLASAKTLIPLAPDVMQQRALDLVQAPWSGKSTNAGTTKDDGCLMTTYTIEVADVKTQTTKNYKILVQAPDGAKGPVPVIVIVPTIDGTRDFLEPKIARGLCHNGMGSIIADVNDMTLPKVYPAWEAEDNNDRRAILALRTVVDFAESVPRFDKNKIGAIGLSLGAITTAMFGSIEPRLKAVITVVGGGNLPHILSASDHWLTEELRTNRIKAAGLKDIAAYEDMLRQTVTYDPFYFAPMADKQKIMMVMAQSDVKVPYVDQREQFEAWGRPQSTTFMGGHVDTIIAMIYLYFGDMTDFLNKRFAAADKAKLLSPMLDVQEPITHKVVNLDDLGL